jgi:hypothetical protein
VADIPVIPLLLISGIVEVPVSDGLTLKTTEPVPVLVLTPVPPRLTLRAVVNPDSDVISLFAPDAAAPRFIRAAGGLAMVARLPDAGSAAFAVVCAAAAAAAFVASTPCARVVSTPTALSAYAVVARFVELSKGDCVVEFPFMVVAVTVPLTVKLFTLIVPAVIVPLSHADHNVVVVVLYSRQLSELL